MSKPIQAPQDLVDAFKKSGEFDRLRRDLLAEFRKSDGISNFRSRVEDIAQSHLRRQKDRKRPADADADALQRNLMSEMDRFPIVDRAITEMRVFRDDSAVKTNVNNSLMRVLLRSRGEPIPPELEELHDEGGDISPRKARSPSRADDDRDYRGDETPDLRLQESEMDERVHQEAPSEEPGRARPEEPERARPEEPETAELEVQEGHNHPPENAEMDTSPEHRDTPPTISPTVQPVNGASISQSDARHGIEDVPPAPLPMPPPDPEQVHP